MQTEKTENPPKKALALRADEKSASLEKRALAVFLESRVIAAFEERKK